MPSTSGSDSDSAPTILTNKKGKRKLYKCEIIKNARLKGEEYINYKGAVVSAKEQGENCGCKVKCYNRCSEGDRQEILQKFRLLATKNEQDAYLQALISYQNVKVKRPRNIGRAKPKSYTFK
ncbi:uncharacterized protein LOC126744177 [Anthonomus grandis grandis]|uniref:uncharacterized protein LOC126744177 n=1 Tax=Anthonomus grandis grandis TaxID=2921223 RepID=UPI0021666E34|nr:uncharacterized protein LOC126744177 [Anthonomus grandis grandis]